MTQMTRCTQCTVKISRLCLCSIAHNFNFIVYLLSETVLTASVKHFNLVKMQRINVKNRITKPIVPTVKKKTLQ